MSQRRVVVTGLGIISCIGNDAATVTESLKNGTCGIKHDPKMAELGFRSQVSGRPEDTSEAAKEVMANEASDSWATPPSGPASPWRKR